MFRFAFKAFFHTHPRWGLILTFNLCKQAGHEVLMHTAASGLLWSIWGDTNPLMCLTIHLEARHAQLKTGDSEAAFQRHQHLLKEILRLHFWQISNS